MAATGKSSNSIMTLDDILNIRLDASGVANILQWLKDDGRKEKTGIRKRHSLITIRDLICICAIRVEDRQKHLDRMKYLTGNKVETLNMKAFAERLGISRQTLYNWRDEGWVVMNGRKVSLPRTIELWDKFTKTLDTP